MRKSKYHLWLLKNDAESLAYATEKQRFYRATADYILVYAKRMSFSGKKLEIKGEQLRKMTSGEREWLLDCNMVILREETKKREAEIANEIGIKMEQFEAALLEEQRRMEADAK